MTAPDAAPIPIQRDIFNELPPLYQQIALGLEKLGKVEIVEVPR